MPNFQPVYYDDADKEVRKIYDEIRESLGFEVLPNWVIYIGQDKRYLCVIMPMRI